MRADKQIDTLDSIIDDYKKADVLQEKEIKVLQEEIIRLHNGLRMLLVAESWEKQPESELVEAVNQLLQPRGSEHES